MNVHVEVSSFIFTIILTLMLSVLICFQIITTRMIITPRAYTCEVRLIDKFLLSVGHAKQFGKQLYKGFN